ncbi:MAG TPA: hypothetical protein VFT01_11435 [Homoserinimonas sp.]|nr:hypothetical protein [Homoserinimonas sp.]
MSKLVRAGLEAVVTITVTLAVIIGAFSALLGMDGLLALSGIYYVIWAAIILVIHLAFAKRRRHLRLSLSVGASVLVMVAHLAMFLIGTINVEINVVPVILHDFGFALVALVVLNIVHLVLFRRRRPKQGAAPAAPVHSERVDDIPAPEAAGRSFAVAAQDEADSEPEQQHAKSA